MYYDIITIKTKMPMSTDASTHIYVQHRLTYEEAKTTYEQVLGHLEKCFDDIQIKQIGERDDEVLGAICYNPSSPSFIETCWVQVEAGVKWDTDIRMRMGFNCRNGAAEILHCQPHELTWCVVDKKDSGTPFEVMLYSKDPGIVERYLDLDKNHILKKTIANSIYGQSYEDDEIDLVVAMSMPFRLFPIKAKLLEEED